MSGDMFQIGGILYGPYGDDSPPSMDQVEEMIKDAIEAGRAEREDEIERLRYRVAELETSQQWQPIETAPKDGTEVLVCYIWDDGTEHIQVARYVDGDWRYAGDEYSMPVGRWTKIPNR